MEYTVERIPKEPNPEPHRIETPDVDRGRSLKISEFIRVLDAQERRARPIPKPQSQSKARAEFERIRTHMLALSKVDDALLDEIIGELEDAQEALAAAMETIRELSEE